jgi:N-acyl homoserine lactone hydrolase
MGVTLHATTCGWLESDLGAFVAGARGPIRVPVPVFVIRHPRGVAVFDTGLHVAAQADPEDRLGVLARAFRVRFAPGEELAARLETLDLDPDRVDWLVTSHLHFDHAGGMAQLPNARWVVQRREWEASRDEELRRRLFYDPRDFDLGHDRLLVDGAHDLFGDGSVTCLPTFGHTPGHQSLRVRTDGGDVVLTADACYLRRTLERLELPPAMYDRAATLASLTRLRALRDAGARLVLGHDPEDWSSVTQAPRAL